MTALLGLLAVAGYQNRDKLAEMLGGLGPKGSAAPDSSRSLPSGLGGLLGGLGGAGAGGFLTNGLNELVDRFKQGGQGDVAESWISTGQNKEIAPQHLEKTIGDDVLATLSEQTGLSRSELLSRLARNLPEAVDGAG